MKKKPRRRKKMTPVQRWLYREWRRNKKAFEDDSMGKLFGSERGCSAVFVALQAIAFEAYSNKDSVCEDACFEAMTGLAKGRLAYLETTK